MKVDFKKEYYNMIKEAAELDDYPYGTDFCGEITSGAVCCQLSLLNDPTFGETESNAISNSMIVNGNFYLLGKDGGYGEMNGIPYDLVDGFYLHVGDTYKETYDSFVKTFINIVNNNNELKNGIASELSWD